MPSVGQHRNKGNVWGRTKIHFSSFESAHSMVHLCSVFFLQSDCQRICTSPSILNFLHFAGQVGSEQSEMDFFLLILVIQVSPH